MSSVGYKTTKNNIFQPVQTRKFNNRKTTIDGISFDSKKEANYYCELKLRKRAGDILDFECHPKFELLKGFTDSEGRTQRPITYTPDFIVYHNGYTEIIDVKGGRATQTRHWKDKWKMLKYQFRFSNTYKFTVVS